MENQLPDIIEFAGSGITEGDFKVSLNKLLLYLDELLGTDGQKLNLIPSGIISMWSGATNAIPTGWSLCNGENGTPDLRDKFIVGAGGNYEAGATGGNTSTTISGNTGETTLTIAQIPSHSHLLVGDGGEGMSGGTATVTIRGTQPNYTGFIRRQVYTGGEGGGGSHSHSLSGNVQTLPPYYALCFIMKI